MNPYRKIVFLVLSALAWGMAGEVRLTGQDEPSAPASRVVFAGYGWPEEFFVLSYQELLDFLRSEGVLLRKDPGDREADWMNTGSFEYFRDNIQDLSAGSLLYMRLDLGDAQVDQLILRCYDEKGEFIWEERTAGIMAMSYRGAAKALTKRMKKKLKPHIGRLGLPVDPDFVPPGKKK